MKTAQLILDSGATKTAWAIVQAGTVLQQGQTTGLNPYLNRPNELSDKINEIAIKLEDLPQKIHFYGSGCRALDSKALMHSLLSQAFPNAQYIEVEDDITGVAKALLQKKAGVACILGTGASSGLYNGERIIQYAPSNGIWLGDEGSGAYLGKQLIKAYLDELLPEDLRRDFENTFPDRREDILQQVYGQQSPSAYLGSFTPFMKTHQHHSFIARILKTSFNDFFERFVKYKPLWEKYPICIGGSTAHHFLPVIQNVAQAQGIAISKVSQKIMDSLVAYHQAKN